MDTTNYTSFAELKSITSGSFFEYFGDISIDKLLQNIRIVNDDKSFMFTEDFIKKVADHNIAADNIVRDLVAAMCDGNAEKFRLEDQINSLRLRRLDIQKMVNDMLHNTPSNATP